MPSPESLIAALHELEERVRSHHDALWEEEKHYTWFLTLLLPAIGLVFMATSVRPWVRVLAETVICLFGLIMSRNAIAVITRESELMHEALRLGDDVAATLHLTWRGPLDRPVRRDLRELIRYAPAWLFRDPSKVDPEKALGIRDAFRLTFELFGVMFLLGLLFLTVIAFLLDIYPR